MLSSFLQILVDKVIHKLDCSPIDSRFLSTFCLYSNDHLIFKMYSKHDLAYTNNPQHIHQQNRWNIIAYAKWTILMKEKKEKRIMPEEAFIQMTHATCACFVNCKSQYFVGLVAVTCLEYIFVPCLKGWMMFATYFPWFEIQ